MGKLAKLFYVLSGLILFAGFAHSANYGINGINITHTLSTARLDSGDKYVQIRLLGETIPTSSSITIDFSGIGGASYFDSKITSVSAGAITTGNYNQAFKDLSGALSSVVSGTHTQGTELTEFKTDFMRYTIHNLQAAPVTATGNIILSW